MHVAGTGGHRPEDGAPDRVTVDELTSELLERGLTATWQVVPDADPAAGILRVAGTIADPLLILACHGRAGLRRLARGSVTLDVLHRSPYPVLVVPPGRHAPD